MVWRKDFTDREKEITNLISIGLTNDEISKKLSISEPKVKTHLRSIYSKTDIHDRANLAIRVLNSDKINLELGSFFLNEENLKAKCLRRW